MSDFRSFCRGLPPLAARVPEWMVSAATSDTACAAIEQVGSPINVINPSPFCDNVRALRTVAARHELDFQVFFARKANKCLRFVTAAREIECGVDTASFDELSQALECGIPTEDLICTAAVKSDALLRLCVESSVSICIDNSDELAAVVAVARSLNRPANCQLRVSGFHVEGEKLWSRFGVDVDNVLDFAASIPRDTIEIVGLQFHLDGYRSDHRVAGIIECLGLVDALRRRGFDIQSLDIGGGFPVCYLEHSSEWNDFWDAHTRSLTSGSNEVTFRRHRLGRCLADGTITGQPNVYPYWQETTGADWLDGIFATTIDDATVASHIQRRDLQLRCEPGRFLLDGSGFTVAKVEFTKTASNGDLLVGLAMNRTQCRTGSDDFLVDPLVIPRSKEGSRQSGQEGYLVGAYCTESELISLRRYRFPHGIHRGDHVVFPNTAGYFMHFLESRSHQMPLAANYVVASDGSGELARDEIDTTFRASNACESQLV